MTRAWLASICFLCVAAMTAGPAEATAQDLVLDQLDKEAPRQRRLVEVPLESVIKFVGEKSGLTIVVETAAFQAAGFKDIGQQSVNVPRTCGVSTKTLLEFLASQVQGVLTVRENRVVLTHRSTKAEPLKPSPNQLLAAREGTRKLKEEFPEIGQRIEGVPLQSVLEFVSDKKDMTIWVDEAAFRRLGARDVVGQRQIKLDVMKNKSLAQVLPVILDQVDATYTVMGEVVLIIPRLRS